MSSGRRHPVLDQPHRLHQEDQEHAVDGKAGDVLDRDRHLVGLAAEAQRGFDRLGRGVEGGNDFDQLHARGRREIMRADEQRAARLADIGGQGRDRDRRSIAGEDAAGLADRVEASVGLGLDPFVLEHRLGDEIACRKRVERDRRGDARQRQRLVLRLEKAARDAAVEDAARAGRAPPSSRSSPVSDSSTSCPARAKTSAISAPISPAPTTPIFSVAMLSVPSSASQCHSGAALGRNPESRNTATRPPAADRCSWIPGSPLRSAPE